ncbi:MAG: hypothetical protein AAB598_00215 [Patescibacteria group bacterium]
MKTDKEVMDLFEQSLDSDFDRRLFRKYPGAVIEAYIRVICEKEIKTAETIKLCDRLSQILKTLKKEV